MKGKRQEKTPMVVLDRAQAGLRKRLLMLAWPAILEMVLHMMVGIVDTAMVGRLGPQELAAVGLGSRILFSVVFVFAAMGTGAAALVARAVGAKDWAGTNRIAAQAMVLGFLAGGAIALVGFTSAGSLFSWLQVEPLVARLGREYLQITMLPAVLILPLFIANALFRGAGNTRVPMIIALITNGVNIVGDYVLIFGKGGFPALGVAGAAVATATAQVLGCLLALGILIWGALPLRLHPRDFLFWDGKLVGRILRLSLPAGLEELVFSLGGMVFTFMVTSLGTVSFAAHQIATSVESLSYMPGHGFAIAAATTVGQNLGANHLDEAEEGGWQGALLALLVMTGIGVLFFSFPRHLASLFAPGEAEVIALGAAAIRISALGQPAIAVEMVLAGALRG
ncbi:MAG TPA: MATE family efflux transporter, partial [Firmicutes bacterium]|nr:MATE family efflux transporter [Bacillota bacterium]